MITKVILQMFGTIVSFFLGLFPSMGVPGWWTSTVAFVTSTANGAAGLGNYLPVGQLIVGLSFILAAYGLALLVRVVRWVQSSLTGGGGVT